jgi:transcriptional regulator with XRE-family HTH domain
MDADELKALRKELGVTARDLAATLGVEQETVLEWERGELFPTKAHVDKLEELRRAGPGSVPKRAKKGASPLELLADPAIWTLLRKLLVHDSLRREVLRLAEKHPDPLDGAGR